MRKPYSYIRWFFAGSLIIMGIGTIIESKNYIGGPVAIFCGIFILPPITSAIRKKSPVGAWVLWLAFICGTAGAVMNEPRAKGGPENQLTQAQRDSTNAVNAANKKIADDIGLASYKADRAIKKALKDPDSYEQIEHQCGTDEKSGFYISCLVKYRAKNSFGGYAVEQSIVSFNDKLEPVSMRQVK